MMPTCRTMYVMVPTLHVNAKCTIHNGAINDSNKHCSLACNIKVCDRCCSAGLWLVISMTTGRLWYYNKLLSSWRQCGIVKIPWITMFLETLPTSLPIPNHNYLIWSWNDLTLMLSRGQVVFNEYNSEPYICLYSDYYGIQMKYGIAVYSYIVPNSLVHFDSTLFSLFNLEQNNTFHNYYPGFHFTKVTDRYTIFL